MNEVIIRILDNSNNVLGDLDLKDFNDFPLVITKGIVNLDNLKTRTGTYTKSFKVPNTRNNSVLLSNTDDINSRKDYKDALGRKPCSIMVNGNEIEKGFVQVSKSYNGFDVDSFELVFFGNNIDWVKQAAELKVNDIPFLNNAQIYTKPNIDAANHSDSDSFDHCYPYISRGGQSPSNDTQVEDYYPCFYLSNIIKRGLNYMGEDIIGWNVVSNFLDDDNVKKLACDLNGDMKVSQSVVDESKTRASRITSFRTSGNTPNSQWVSEDIGFSDKTTYPNEDNNVNWNIPTDEYTAPTSGRYNFEVSIKIGDFSAGFPYDQIETKLNIVNQFNNIKGQQEKNVILNDKSSDTIIVYDITMLLNAGDSVRIFFEWFQKFTEDFYIKSGSFFKVQRSFELVKGDSFNLTDVIPDDIKLIDVINDFTRMFNIYYWTDVKTRTIYLEPRNTFFKDTTSALDWSNKLDLSKMYEIDYVSSYKRNLTFSYKDLDSDEWLKGWEKTYKRKCGEYTHKLPDRFGEGTTKIKLDLFSASYSHMANEATPLNESPFTTLKYWNKYQEDGQAITKPPSERISGYNCRVFNFNNGVQRNLDSSYRRISFEGQASFLNIPYAIFESYNNTDAPINLSFTGNDGLFDTYYSNMLKNIEEGGRLVAYFNLNSTDIDNLDFRKLVYIDAPAQAKGYYLVERVEDFNPINNGLTKVSLFKYENLGSVELDNSQQGNNNSSDDNASQETLEPIYIEDRGFLVGVFNENSNGLIEKVLK